MHTTEDKVKVICAAFGVAATSLRLFSGGHIHDTYLVTSGLERYVLQRINTFVFAHPLEVMENIEAVTQFLSKSGPSRSIVKTLDGKLLYTNPADASVWRMFTFIENSISIEKPGSENDMFQAGKGYGAFMAALDGFPSERLHVIIPGFHHTPNRFVELDEAIRNDKQGRASGTSAFIQDIMMHRDYAASLQKQLNSGRLPLRVTHNDTKIGNILFDALSGEALCVIDLDTVMPGIAATDFGDAIRSGCNSANEDEADLSKVNFIESYYRAFRDGFLENASPVLTAEEKQSLFDGACIITLEQSVRFLSDYLNGDVYYKTEREGQNLDRALNQFHLYNIIKGLGFRLAS
jgi:Ser/Thr protein kinase RdoA (MazF antagonist)